MLVSEFFLFWKFYNANDFSCARKKNVLTKKMRCLLQMSPPATCDRDQLSVLDTKLLLILQSLVLPAVKIGHIFIFKKSLKTFEMETGFSGIEG